MLFVPTPSSLLSDLLSYYVNTVSISKRSYKSEVYRIRALNDLMGDFKLEEIMPVHVVAYRDKRLATPHPRIPEKTLATSTVKHELMLLSHLFSIAIAEWGMTSLVNPVLKIRKPKAPPGRTRRLNPQEEKKLLRKARQHSNPEFYAIVVLALETAMRQGEILALCWENVNWRKRTVMLPVTKNGDAREVPLSKTAYAILKEYLCPTTKGKIFTYTSAGLKSTWRFLIREIEIHDFHFHDLRHCAISSLLERGLNVIEVATISGHKSLAMLKRYSHLDVGKLVDKLDPKPRSKKERPILRNHLPPYPALITKHSRKVEIDFPDFTDFVVSGSREDIVMKEAQERLLRHMVGMLCDGATPPFPSPPESILLPSRKSRIEMISPI